MYSVQLLWIWRLVQHKYQSSLSRREYLTNLTTLISQHNFWATLWKMKESRILQAWSRHYVISNSQCSMRTCSNPSHESKYGTTRPQSSSSRTCQWCTVPFLLLLRTKICHVKAFKAKCRVSQPHNYRKFRTEYYLPHPRGFHSRKWVECKKWKANSRKHFCFNNPLKNQIKSNFTPKYSLFSWRFSYQSSESCAPNFRFRKGTKWWGAKSLTASLSRHLRAQDLLWTTIRGFRWPYVSVNVQQETF